ncbi:MAG: ThiF family adenylyltransferase, partial [archaeon]|nr:ThiF family adenylyltransferase [archaeon]
FLVGCGALGCEYMKAFALMGVGCGPQGELIATDMDTIEVSNLARQFLFRRQHVHKPKSVCAAQAARAMNPSMKIRVYEDKVAPDTEGLFDHTFWSSLTGVCNALDNVQARLYVDSRCVFFQRPLLESGTLGTKANVEVIVPHKTGNFAQGHVEEKEKHVPQCTMKNFPYMIEHTIGWAGKAGEFNNLFVTPATDLKAAVDDLSSLWKALDRLQMATEKIERLESLTELLAIAKQPTFEQCIHLAFKRLIAQYRDAINDLTYRFPADFMVTEREGKKLPEPMPFWSAPKRFPTSIQWDPTNPDSSLVEYLYNAANLYAHMFHLDPVRDEDEGRPAFRALLIRMNISPPQWQVDAKKIAALESSTKDPSEKPEEGAAASSSSSSPAPAADSPEEDQAKLDALKAQIEAFDFSALRAKNEQIKAANPKDSVIRPAEFEKDDDTNFHIDFVTSSSNLRAFNYSIPSADRHRTKMIAGNIIPAIATTTAMITGLNSIEFIKLKLGLDINMIRSANINLGISAFNLFEPDAPAKAAPEYDFSELCDVVPVPDGFTVWNRVIVDRGDLTVQEFIDALPSIHHGVEPISFIAYKTKPLPGALGIFYTDTPAIASLKAKVAAYKTQKISDIWVQEYGPLPNCEYLQLDVACVLNDTPVKIPNPVIFKFK